MRSHNSTSIYCIEWRWRFARQIHASEFRGFEQFEGNRKMPRNACILITQFEWKTHDYASNWMMLHGFVWMKPRVLQENNALYRVHTIVKTTWSAVLYCICICICRRASGQVCCVYTTKFHTRTFVHHTNKPHICTIKLYAAYVHIRVQPSLFDWPSVPCRRRRRRRSSCVGCNCSLNIEPQRTVCGVPCFYIIVVHKLWCV